MTMRFLGPRRQTEQGNKLPSYTLLAKKDLVELIEMAIAQMRTCQHFSDSPLKAVGFAKKDNHTYYMVTQLGGVKADRENSYDTGILYCTLAKKLGQELTLHPDLHRLHDISERLVILMDAAEFCEKKVEEGNKTRRDYFRKMGRPFGEIAQFFMTANYSRENHAMLLILKGYTMPIAQPECTIDGPVEDLYPEATAAFKRWDSIVDYIIYSIGITMGMDKDGKMRDQLAHAFSRLDGLRQQSNTCYRVDPTIESDDSTLFRDNQRKLITTYRVLSAYVR